MTRIESPRPTRFEDRTAAGRWLAERLRPLAPIHPVVLALTRGGLQVAHEVALALGAPLGAFAVRKIGVPGNEQLAMGAVATGGIRVLNEDVLRQLRITREALREATLAQLTELERRERTYLAGRMLPSLPGATVILVDDGVVTGTTMLAAVQAARARRAATVVVASPVMSRQAHVLLARVADGCVGIVQPEPFTELPAYYANFETLDEAGVVALLDDARARVPAGRVPLRRATRGRMHA